MNTWMPRALRPRAFPLFLVPLAILGAAGESFAQTCLTVPAANCQYLMPAEGDFELALDPLDDHVLFLTNDGTSCAAYPPPAAEAWVASPVGDIVLRQLDLDGDLPNPLASPNHPSNPHVRWVDAYVGCDFLNGPEFISPALSTSDALGLVYRGNNNVGDVGLMVLQRPSSPASWDAFGAEYGPVGPQTVYPAPDIVAYPSDVFYGAWLAEPGSGVCEQTCVGAAAQSPTVVSLPAALASMLPPYTVYAQALHPTLAGTAVVTGCNSAGTCGLAFATLDAAAGTVTGVAPKLTLANPATDGGTLGGATFPGRPDTFWFAIDATKHLHVIRENALHQLTDLLSVLPLDAAGTPFTPTAMDHVSVAAGDDQLVAYVQVNSGANTGTYKIVISWTGVTYVHDDLDRFSTCEHTVEVVHSTTAGWLSYENNSDQIYRCVQPW